MSYLNKINIEIVSSKAPQVIRSCSKCGKAMPFKHSGCFRANANKGLIDVWLIYHCSYCNTTWNIPIYERTDVSQIPKGQYLKFMSNDKVLAEKYASGKEQHRRCKLKLLWDNEDYSIISTSMNEKCTTENIAEYTINCSLPVHLRTDTLLAKLLKLSRSKIQGLYELGAFLEFKEKRLFA